MDKYIKAQDVREAFEKFIWSPLPKAMSYANFIVERLPAADVRPVMHGSWVDPDEYITPYQPAMHHTCSFCGWLNYYSLSFKYCPNCGAKMDGDKNG